MAYLVAFSRLADEYIGVIGAGLAYLVAGIHLTHPKLGFPRLILLAQYQRLDLLANDPRPVVFVVSGIAIILGVPIATTNRYRKPLYALGIVLMLSYLVGYFAWHLSGHGGFLPGRQPLYHGMTPLEAVVAHLSGNLRASLSKFAELGLLAILIVLYRQEK